MGAGAGEGVGAGTGAGAGGTEFVDESAVSSIGEGAGASEDEVLEPVKDTGTAAVSFSGADIGAGTCVDADEVAGAVAGACTGRGTGAGTGAFDELNTFDGVDSGRVIGLDIDTDGRAILFDAAC